MCNLELPFVPENQECHRLWTKNDNIKNIKKFSNFISFRTTDIRHYSVLNDCTNCLCNEKLTVSVGWEFHQNCVQTNGLESFLLDFCKKKWTSRDNKTHNNYKEVQYVI